MKKNYLVLVLLTIIFMVPAAKAQLYYKDVAQIFYNRCTSCHHEGQAGQSMLNYSQTFPWASAILYDLQTAKMPPWHPDTTYSRFINEHLISPSEKAAIVDWINGGALQGDTTLAPLPPSYSTQFQLNGVADLTLKIPTYTNTASSDSYNCFSIPTGLTQDRIIRAIEIIPGNLPIVHHVVCSVDTMGATSSNLSGSCFNQPGEVGLGGWAPGSPPIIFPGAAPLKAGIRLKGGSKVVMQIHYAPGTFGQVDSTKIRLYFFPLGETGIRPIHSATLIQNWGLSLPANVVTTATAKYPSFGTISTPMSVYGTNPHSHKICTSILNYAYAGTDTIPIIRINKWDFEWEGFYYFPNLLKIPAGYKLFSKHVFDNTSNNPDNPSDPPQYVMAGTSTGDEMLFDSFIWLDYQAGDELIDVEAILENDPLLVSPTPTLNVGEIASSTDIKTYVFPNPASGKVTIGVSKKSEYKVRISNVRGQHILQTGIFTDETTIDVKNIPSGLYIVDVMDVKTNERITKKIVINN